MILMQQGHTPSIPGGKSLSGSYRLLDLRDVMGLQVYGPETGRTIKQSSGRTPER